MLFAGLAIQIERPFRVGHWISLTNYEGRVVEVTWRATKIRTKAGNLVIIPNSTVGREAITNYSEPTAPTRQYVEVGATYAAAAQRRARRAHGGDGAGASRPARTRRPTS